MSEQITLSVDLPEVYEAAYRIEVRCGETTCDVYEHGMRGSGDWAAWKAQGYITGEGGTIGYTVKQALDDARAYVRMEERRRLMWQQVRAALEVTDA